MSWAGIVADAAALPAPRAAPLALLPCRPATCSHTTGLMPLAIFLREQPCFLPCSKGLALLVDAPFLLSSQIWLGQCTDEVSPNISLFFLYYQKAWAGSFLCSRHG